VPALKTGVDVKLPGAAKVNLRFVGPESSVRYGTFWPAGVVVHVGKLATPPTTEELTACVVDASESDLPPHRAMVTEVNSKSGEPVTIALTMPEGALETTLSPVQAFVIGLTNSGGKIVAYGLVEYFTPGWAAAVSLLALILIFPILGVNMSLPPGQRAGLGARVLLKPMYRGADGYLSISLLQITLWTVVASWAIAYVFLRSYSLLSMTPEVMGLLGFAGATAVSARIIAGRRRPFMRDEQGNIVPAKSKIAKDAPSPREARRSRRWLRRRDAEAYAQPNEPQQAGDAERKKDRSRGSDWMSLVSGQNGFDLVKFQLLLFTVLTAAYVVYRVFKEGVFPALSPEFLLLMGISNSVYLANKFVNPSELDTLEALTIRKDEIGDEVKNLEDRKAELAKRVAAIEKEAASDALTKEKTDAEARIKEITAELEKLAAERKKIDTDLAAINAILTGK
jgi:hypothetical protein